MAGKVADFVTLTESDIEPDAPSLRLDIRAGTRLSTTLPYRITFTIHWSLEYGRDSPIIFRWSPYQDGFVQSGFMLLHHSPDGLQEVKPDDASLVKAKSVSPISVNGYNHYLWQLSPGDKTTFQATLPEKYQKLLVPGESYELLWPGGVIDIWDWGTIKDHLNQELQARPEHSQRLVIPGGAHVPLRADVEVVAWPDRARIEKAAGFTLANVQEERWRLAQKPPPSPPPIGPSEVVPYAPILRASLDCAPTMRVDEGFEVQVRIHLPGDSKRPIIFHTYAFTASSSGREGFRLDRQRGDKWEECAEDGNGNSFMIVDDPDVPVHVAKHSDFVILQPGQDWTLSKRINAEDGKLGRLPEDTAIGDVFRCRFKGAMVDWWDEGDSTDHAETVVKLPCWIAGAVVDPAHNDGRPKLVVPASNTVYFTIG